RLARKAATARGPVLRRRLAALPRHPAGDPTEGRGPGDAVVGLAGAGAAARAADRGDAGAGQGRALRVAASRGAPSPRRAAASDRRSPPAALRLLGAILGPVAVGLVHRAGPDPAQLAPDPLRAAGDRLRRRPRARAPARAQSRSPVLARSRTAAAGVRGR